MLKAVSDFALGKIYRPHPLILSPVNGGEEIYILFINDMKKTRFEIMRKTGEDIQLC
jgi:hypothetical protein